MFVIKHTEHNDYFAGYLLGAKFTELEENSWQYQTQKAAHNDIQNYWLEGCIIVEIE